MKKTLSIILAAAIMLTLFVFAPTTVEAKKSGDYVYTVTDGEAEITAYTGSESYLVIPSEFDGVPITSIGYQSFKRNQSLTSVIIPDSVISIHSYAFNNCESLNYLSIGNSVTTIDEDAFSCCYKLKNISFPNSLISIGACAFSATSWLESQRDGVVYVGNIAYEMKGNCPAEVELKDGTIGIAGSAFSNCNSLIKISIPNSVTNIGRSAFSECNNLKEIVIPDSVVDIEDGLFYNCKALESVTIGNSVRSIGRSAFCDCVSLESVTIPKSVEKIDIYAFSDCVSLEKVTILNPNVTISWEMFMLCNALTIYGYHNSTAENFANSYSIPFVPLDGEPTTEPTTQAVTEPTTQASVTEPVPESIKGDVDGDGRVTISDVTAIQRYLAEYENIYNIGE